MVTRLVPLNSNLSSTDHEMILWARPASYPLHL